MAKEHYGVFIIVGIVIVLAVALIFYSGGTVGEAKYGLARAKAPQACPPRVCPACPTPTHIMSEGESQTWVVNGVEYEIELLVVSETSGEVKFRINGEITDALKIGQAESLNDGSMLVITAIRGSQVEAAILPTPALR